MQLLRKSPMKPTARKIDAEDYILSALSPKERFDAALRVAREAFRDTTLTIEDIEATVRKVRRKRYAARQKKAARRR
ncbi:MAG: hypothetical protein ACREQY_20075 [Candidatus Binatia bacterium]